MSQSANLVERRQFDRRTVNLPGQLITGSQANDCVVFDISAGGAVVAAQAEAEPQQAVRLKLTERGEFSGTVAWRRADRIGIKFDFLDESRVGF